MDKLLNSWGVISRSAIFLKDLSLCLDLPIHWTFEHTGHSGPALPSTLTSCLRTPPSRRWGRPAAATSTARATSAPPPPWPTSRWRRPPRPREYPRSTTPWGGVTSTTTWRSTQHSGKTSSGKLRRSKSFVLKLFRIMQPSARLGH